MCIDVGASCTYLIDVLEDSVVESVTLQSLVLLCHNPYRVTRIENAPWPRSVNPYMPARVKLATGWVTVNGPTVLPATIRGALAEWRDNPKPGAFRTSRRLA